MGSMTDPFLTPDAPAAPQETLPRPADARPTALALGGSVTTARLYGFDLAERHHPGQLCRQPLPRLQQAQGRGDRIELMWQIDNRTPFAADSGWVRDRRGAELWLVAVKATFSILPDGTTTPAAEQPPVLHVPEYFGDPAHSSMKYDADLLLEKRTTDVVLHAHACARGDEPVAVLDVGFRRQRFCAAVRPSACSISRPRACCASLCHACISASRLASMTAAGSSTASGGSIPSSSSPIIRGSRWSGTPPCPATSRSRSSNGH